MWRSARQRLYSRKVSIGVRRDLSVASTVRPAKIPLFVRQLRPDDDLSLIDALPGLAHRNTDDRAAQRWFLNAGLPAPWVAIDERDGRVCFMTWVLAARDNARIRDLWGELFPELQPDEVLIEGIYSAESHRGLGVMPAATDQILERAVADMGVRYAIGIIDEENGASLKGAANTRFDPFVTREERWFLLRRRVRFLPLDEQVETI